MTYAAAAILFLLLAVLGLGWMAFSENRRWRHLTLDNLPQADFGPIRWREVVLVAAAGTLATLLVLGVGAVLVG